MLNIIFASFKTGGEAESRQEAVVRLNSIKSPIAAGIRNRLLECVFLLLQGQRITEVNSPGSVSWTLSVLRSVAAREQL